MIIKNYSYFIKENIYDPFNEEDLNYDDQDILYKIADKSKFKYIFLPNPVLVGYKSDNKKECYCNYFYRHTNKFYNEDYLVYNILYNERTDNKLINDKLWDFNYIKYEDFKSGLVKTRPYINNRFLDEIDIQFDFFPDFLDKICSEVNKINQEWIDECDEIMNESREWVSLCHYSNKKEIDWDRQIYHLECLIKYEELLHFSKPLSLIKELNKMKEMGEILYKKKQEEINNFVMDFLKKEKNI